MIDETELKSGWQGDQRMFIPYCTIAGSISVWAISGLLVVVDLASGTPPGTFFSVIGISLGYNDPAIAQYIGFGLHLLAGTVAGNIYGQASTFWRWIAPNNYRHGIMTGLIVGVTLWAVLFVPVTTFGIQPRLDHFSRSAPNQYIFEISGHFQPRIISFNYRRIVGLPSNLWYYTRISRWKDDRSAILSEEMI